MPRMAHRSELLVCGALLLGYAALRAAAAGPLAFDLLDPEELLNLRLAWQRAEGLPVGDLGRYWYTGAGGAVGAGPLVLSLLYLPLGLFGDLDFGATRAMAGLWAIGTAIVTAGLGRRLLGTGGAAATLLAMLALPPSWLAWTCTANGNYLEAAGLTLAGAWIAIGAQRPGRAAAAGAVLGFSGWFCVSAAGPAVLVGLATGWRLRPNGRSLAALVGGLILGCVPLALLLEPAAAAESPVDAAAVGGLWSAVASDPLSWPALVASSLGAVPLLSYREVQAADWAPGWLVAVEPLWKAGLWAAFAAAVLGGLRQGSQRALIAVGGACALAVPVGLTLLGVGPADGPIEPLYFYDGRRAALVLPLLALGAAAVGLHLSRRGAAWRAGAVAVALFCAVPSLLLIDSGEAPPSSFHPGRYLLCPADAPVDRDAVCIDALWEDQVATLEALVERPDLAAVDARREALRGFGAVERDEDRCALPTPPGGDRGWFGVGAATGSGCPAQVEAVCGGVDACEHGARWAAGLGS